jgi:PKD repeat protein
MRNALLLLLFSAFGMNAFAQQVQRDGKLNQYLQDQPVVSTSHPANQTAKKPITKEVAGSRGGGLSTILNSIPIGTAGNLLTIIDNTTNQLDVNDSLNAVIFIHRNDPDLFPGTNVAQYRYSSSSDRGATWTSNIGPITNDVNIDNVTVNGRFPQAVIYNPAGNTSFNDAYMVYSGTWHDGNRWKGEMRGRGKLSGDTSTFNVAIDQVNGGVVGIAGGLTQSTPGTFWNVNAANTGTFAAGVNQIISGLVVMKGVWDDNTNTVNWTEQLIPVNFQSFDNGGTLVSAATSFKIAFDPTGQKGWIGCLGDLTADGNNVYQPIFIPTTDGGQTWGTPVQVELKDVQGVMGELATEWINGQPSTMNPTCAFDANMAVDVNGNPHLVVTVGNGSDYSIEPSSYDVWDFTYDANAIAGCNWQGIHLAEINTLRGTFSNDNPAQTEDNRPLISRSPDASKIFFFWLESDVNVTLSNDNDVPNLFGRGIDVLQKTMTPLYNFTEGDTLWGGETEFTPGGAFGGAIFPQVSPTVLENGSDFNIPIVFTQIDYKNTSGGLGSNLQSCRFWYVNNMNIAANAFTEPLDQVAPSIVLNGPDTVIQLVGTTYTEQGATAFDCTDGNITPTIVNAPNINQVGVYEVLYIATDAAGNSDTVVRTVIIGAIPVADFTWSFPVSSYRAQFQDASINLPTNWLWQFGDGTGSTAKNPIKNFTTNGTFNVCLRASNSFGQSAQVCKDVTITGVGIDEVQFSNSIKMFPNPSTGKVTLSFEGNVTPDMTVTVYNMLGETILAPARYLAGTTNIELNLTGVSNGLYMVKVQSNKGTAVKHLNIFNK